MHLYSILKDYSIHERIGKGNYGSVYKGLRHGETYAIKRVSMKNQTLDGFHMFKEFLLLQNLVHDNIITILDIYCNDGIKYDIAFVMPYYPMTLGQYIKILSGNIVAFMTQLSSAIYTMHCNGVVHLDLKPDNILIDMDTMSIKIIDFGLARYIGLIDNQLSSICVTTRWYRAPEILAEKSFGAAADIWSLGCIYYEMITGMVLFPGVSDNEQAMLVRARTNIALPNEFKQYNTLLKHMLVKKPSKRYSAGQTASKMGLNLPVMNRFAIAKSVSNVDKLDLNLNRIANINWIYDVMFNHNISVEAICLCIELCPNLNTVCSPELLVPYMIFADQFCSNVPLSLLDWSGFGKQKTLVAAVIQIVSSVKIIPSIGFNVRHSSVTNAEHGLVLTLLYDMNYKKYNPYQIAQSITKFVNGASIDEPSGCDLFVVMSLNRIGELIKNKTNFTIINHYPVTQYLGL